MKGGTMEEIKKVDILSVAKISALFGIIAGLLLGLNFGLSAEASQIELTFSEAIEIMNQYPEAGVGPLIIALGWWSLLVMPIILLIAYYISGLIFSALYNIFAKKFGGIMVDVSEKKATKKKKK